MFHESCEDTIREFALYRWDDKEGCDAPIKENDHAMDDIRYFVTVFCTAVTVRTISLL
jgi:phage terminase large subunit